MSRPPLPPFTTATARQKVKAAQSAWNTRDPAKVSLAYTPDSVWRNRDQFISGRDAIIRFLTQKWAKEKQYRLRKELFAFQDNRIAVQFWYEYLSEEEKSWKRCYGIEHWTFASDGLMQTRQMSGNEMAITEAERWFVDNDVDSVTLPDGHTSALPIVS